MSDQHKFELENMAEKQNKNSKSQRQAILANIDLTKSENIENNSNFKENTKISDDQFFSQFDQMLIVDFNEQREENINDYTCDIENPQIQANLNQKLNGQLQTMIDSDLTSSENQSINEQEQQENSFQLFQFVDDKASVETPQKFKKVINFQQMENEEQSKFFWAPKKPINKKKLFQSN